MTDTRLSREPDVFRRTVREFADATLKPAADRTDREARFHSEAFEEMAGMGLLGLIFPEEYGGMGGDYVLYAGRLSREGKEVPVRPEAELLAGLTDAVPPIGRRRN